MVRYRTGDSFHTEDAEGTVELEWENLGVAREAMKRLEEHYHWRNDHNFEPDIWERRPQWYKLLNDEFDERDAEYVVNLRMDDGTEHTLGVFWLGHFETLYSFEIIAVSPEEEGMRITF